MKPWQCPGPARLLDRVADAVVQGGRSVIVMSPPHALCGMDDELTSLLGTQGWSLARVVDNGSNPARQVLETAWVTEVLSGVVDAATIAGRDDLGGRVFWCEPVEKIAVGRWLSFLDAYQVACRARPDGDWPRFILFIPAVLLDRAPTKKTGIDVFDLGSAASRADLLLFAYDQIGSAHGYGPRAELIAQVAANVAVWDFALLEVLLAEQPDRLMEPAGLLRAYAAELGWTQAAPCWSEGSMLRIGNRDVVHSAKLAVSDPKGEVANRIWSGQAAVLLPIIERRRMKLIEQNLNLLKSKVPFQTLYGTISDVFDIEIGSVWFFLKQHSSGAETTRALRLRHARNSLAHMNPLTPVDAFWEELMSDM